ncbi:unnamed protein product [Polarella glacialis]|uniref:Uncharacterized protein n=1 Tax=Polarella glacialis TaxID=89957 RepID=A0A813E8X1_POLGL|nr:unnamed protein product [Polarella glacialis]CAE8676792.1 unnamed protein product [Polarella glacialis]
MHRCFLLAHCQDWSAFRSDVSRHPEPSTPWQECQTSGLHFAKRPPPKQPRLLCCCLEAGHVAGRCLHAWARRKRELTATRTQMSARPWWRVDGRPASLREKHWQLQSRTALLNNNNSKHSSQIPAHGKGHFKHLLSCQSSAHFELSVPTLLQLLQEQPGRPCLRFTPGFGLATQRPWVVTVPSVGCPELSHRSTDQCKQPS